MGSGYSLVKQAQVRKLDAVLESGLDTTLIGSVNLNQAYRKTTLTARQFRLNEFTNGAFVSLKTTVDGDTGTLEMWGYAEKGGIAKFLGTHTFTTDKAVDDEGLFYVDAFVVGTAAQHTVTIVNFSDGAADLKFDTLGFKFIVCLVTALSSSADPGAATVELRPW